MKRSANESGTVCRSDSKRSRSRSSSTSKPKHSLNDSAMDKEAEEVFLNNSDATPPSETTDDKVTPPSEATLEPKTPLPSSSNAREGALDEAPDSCPNEADAEADEAPLLESKDTDTSLVQGAGELDSASLTH